MAHTLLDSLYGTVLDTGKGAVMLVLVIAVGLCIAGMLFLTISLCLAAANGDEWQRERLDNEQARVLWPGHIARIYRVVERRARIYSLRSRSF